jgi:hypothetical protein
MWQKAPRVPYFFRISEGLRVKEQRLSEQQDLRHSVLCVSDQGTPRTPRHNFLSRRCRQFFVIWRAVCCPELAGKRAIFVRKTVSTPANFCPLTGHSSPALLAGRSAPHTAVPGNCIANCILSSWHSLFLAPGRSKSVQFGGVATLI